MPMEIPENYNVFFFMSGSNLANEIPVFYMRTYVHSGPAKISESQVILQI